MTCKVSHGSFPGTPTLRSLSTRSSQATALGCPPPSHTHKPPSPYASRRSASALSKAATTFASNPHSADSSPHPHKKKLRPKNSQCCRFFSKRCSSPCTKQIRVLSLHQPNESQTRRARSGAPYRLYDRSFSCVVVTSAQLSNNCGWLVRETWWVGETGQLDSCGVAEFFK